jgi:alpha-ribazole phosphatase
MTCLILIRHGETDWNVEGRYQGQSDVPLNDRGRRQSAELVTELRENKPSAIYTSDLKRASESAQILGTALGLPVYQDPRLREIHLGSWEGMLFEEIQAIYSDLLKRRRLDPRTVSAPGGETVEQVRSRVTAAVQDIAKQHVSETIAIVSHGLTLAILISIYQQRPIEEVWDLIPQNSKLFLISRWDYEMD